MKLEKVLSQVTRLDAEGGSLKLILSHLADQGQADVLEELTAIVYHDAVQRLASKVKKKAVEAEAQLNDLQAGLPELQENEAWAGARVEHIKGEVKNLGRGERRRREELKGAVKSAQGEHRKTQMARKGLEGQITAAKQRIVFLSGLAGELQAVEAPQLEYLPIVWATLEKGN